MHPLVSSILRVLPYATIQVHQGRTNFAHSAALSLTEYRRGLALSKSQSVSSFDVFQYLQYDASGDHPESYIDAECAFAASALAEHNPSRILDIGSYRHFILGLLASRSVTTLDVQPRAAACANETVLNGDAKSLPIADSSFDAIVSLCTLEHLGLGRYGDPIDLDADRTAFGEMVRVLRPGGLLILSTTITRARPQIAFNAHRIYSHAMIEDFASGLERVEERFFSHSVGGFSGHSDVTDAAGEFDVYCGVWRKPTLSA